ALVVLVIFLFLRNVPATVIPSIALPMSIIGTFAVMYALDYSLDNISLMALTLCVGFVVDDAIVMLENITRHIESGKSVLAATLARARRHRRAVLLIFLGVCVLTGVLFARAPKGFLPSEDAGQIFCFVEGPQDISFEAMIGLQRQVAEIVRQDPNVDAVMSFVGAGGPSSSLNTGRITINLKPFGQRKPADEVVRGLRPKLANVLGAKVFVQNVPAIRIGGQITRSLYQYVMRSANVEELYHWAPLIEQKLRARPGLLDVSSDLQIARPEVTVQIEREKASALGVSAQSIETALNNAYGARQVSTIYTSTNQYFVILELAPRYQTDPSVLPLLYVRS